MPVFWAEVSLEHHEFDLVPYIHADVAIKYAWSRTRFHARAQGARPTRIYTLCLAVRQR